VKGRAPTENILPRARGADVDRAFEAITTEATRPYRMTPAQLEALRDLARRS
jgi:hypothetical protein